MSLRLRVVLYRKHVTHHTRRNFQLDLFTPDDGHYEYSAVAINLPLGPAAQTFAELKGEFALDVVPTNDYAANSAWQQLSVLAHISRAASSSTPGRPPPSRGRASELTPSSSEACARCAFSSSPGPVASLGSMAATSYA